MSNEIINLLQNYNPSAEDEKEFKGEILSFLENFDNNFSREQKYGHFTASSLLLNSDQTKFLLMHHKKMNLWVQPGGHADGDEDLLRVSLRESIEESGIEDITPVETSIFDIDIHVFPAYKNDPEHFHFDIRFLLKANNDNFIKNNESNDLRWVEFKGYLNPEYNLKRSVTRMVEKYISRKDIEETLFVMKNKKLAQSIKKGLKEPFEACSLKLY